MAVEHINETDLLNDGRVKINQSIDTANSANTNAGLARNQAAQAFINANTAQNMSRATQEQVDNLVLESGDSSPEVVQARGDYDVLAQRVTAMDKKLGMISFTFDGTFAEDKLTKSIFDEFGFVCNFAVCADANWVNTFNGVEFYKQAQREGYGIEAFSRTHLNMSSYSDALDIRIVEREITSCIEILDQLGLKTTGYTSPNSVTAPEYEHFISQNYDYGINGPGVLNNSLDAVQDPLVTDRYHLRRMSLTSNTTEAIKRAIDTCIVEKKFLLFYDHRTGAGEGNVSEEKLREILTYIKENYTDSKKGYVARLSDVITAKYENSLSRNYQVASLASKNLANPIGRLRTAISVPYYNFWGYGAHGSTTTQDTCQYSIANEEILLQLVNSKNGENRSVQMCVDLSHLVDDKRAHSLAWSLPIWMDMSIQANVTIDCRFYTSENTMIGATRVYKLNVTDDRILHTAEFGIPRNAVWAHTYVRVNNTKDNSGYVHMGQPTIAIDTLRYTDEAIPQYVISGFDFKQETITADRTWQWLKTNAQFAGADNNGPDFFETTVNTPEIKCRISGIYEVRLDCAFTLKDELTTNNAGVYIEARVNNATVGTANAYTRMNFLKQDYTNGNVGGTQSIKLALKAGDVLRLAIFKNATGGTLTHLKNPFLTLNRISNY